MSFKILLNILRGEEKEAPVDTESSSDKDSETVKMSESMQMTVKGLPPSLSPDQRAKVLNSLARNALLHLPERTYQGGETIYEGRAQLNILNKIYNVEFSIDATRVLTALAIYKEAFDEINAGAATGVYDEELAELTADYIKESAWREVQAFEKKRIGNVEPSDSNDSTNGLPQSNCLTSPKEESNE
jgi:hypothetical protein